jgi:hypothetical protein
LKFGQYADTVKFVNHLRWLGLNFNVDWHKNEVKVTPKRKG